MKTEEVINILKQIRSRAVAKPTPSLLDYIDGQIDILKTVNDESEPSTAPYLHHPINSVTGGTPRSVECLDSKPTVKRFHGADASANP
jgi:hypothetical protein